MDIVTSAPELVPVDSLSPHPRNPRRGNVEAIAGSVRENGWYGSVVAQRSSGHIIVGKHRWQVAKDEGATQIQVQWADVDDDTAHRILLLDNRTGDVASYDEPALADLLAGLDGDYSGTAWTPDDLTALQASLDQPPDVPPDPGPGPDPGRTVQGLHEVVLQFSSDLSAQYDEAVLRLKRKWETDVTPLVVLRAMREAVAALEPA